MAKEKKPIVDMNTLTEIMAKFSKVLLEYKLSIFEAQIVAATFKDHTDSLRTKNIVSEMRIEESDKHG